jgi:hypothetical protein
MMFTATRKALTLFHQQNKQNKKSTTAKYTPCLFPSFKFCIFNLLFINCSSSYLKIRTIWISIFLWYLVIFIVLLNFQKICFNCGNLCTLIIYFLQKYPTKLPLHVAGIKFYERQFLNRPHVNMAGWAGKTPFLLWTHQTCLSLCCSNIEVG